jgi:hypothetical protein
MDLRKHGWLGQGGNDMCACLCVAQSKKSTLMRAAAFEFFLSSGTMTDTFVDSSAELTSVLIFQMLFFPWCILPYCRITMDGYQGGSSGSGGMLFRTFKVRRS